MIYIDANVNICTDINIQSEYRPSSDFLINDNKNKWNNILYIDLIETAPHSSAWDLLDMPREDMPSLKCLDQKEIIKQHMPPLGNVYFSLHVRGKVPRSTCTAKHGSPGGY